MNEKPKNEEPMEAILVRVIKNKDKMEKRADQLKTVTQIKAPQGPALINGQWW